MVRRIVSEADSRLLESGRNDSQLRVRRPFCVPRIVIFLLQGRGTSFFPPPPPRGKTGGTPPNPRPGGARQIRGRCTPMGLPGPVNPGKTRAAPAPPAPTPARRGGGERAVLPTTPGF